MNDSNKSKDQLIQELEQIREKLAEYEGGEVGGQDLNDTRFRKIFDYSNDAIFILDPENDKIIDVNAKASDLLGYTHDQFLSMPISAIHPDEFPKLRAFAQSVLDQGAGWTDELSCATRSGATLPAEISASTLDVGGQVYMIAMVRDITDRKRAVEALRERELQYKDLYENAPIAYFSLSAEGVIQMANRRSVDLLGYPIEELIGRSALDLYADTESGIEKARKMLQQLKAGKEIQGEELEMRRADGRSVWISLTVQAVQDADGTIVGSRSMVADITGQKQAQKVLADEVRAKYDYEEIIGNSPLLQEVMKKVGMVAPTDSTVLILGETGTGKELICRAIHHLSRRSSKPLVKLNCAAIPSGLIESELFGHEKGAFTGAIAQKQGRFELAHEGSIFLDEIGDIPLDMQPKLLRLLQEQEFERVGGTRTIKVDTRVITATHRDLKQMVQEGTFREDLFYRLNIFPITIPPFRERREDIPLLARYFVRRVCGRLGRPDSDFSKAALQRLQEYSWPGNVRELENIVERAVILCAGGTIDAEHIQVDVGSGPLPEGSFGTLEQVEKQHIVEALKSTGGKVGGKGGAAGLLGLKPTTLLSRMKKLGIDRKPD